jgi:hypothetical protein
MTPATRTAYFRLWSAACRAQKWDSTDQNLRRDITRQVMEAVSGPATDSTSALGPDEITALFTFLEMKAKESLITSARWLDCQKDYRMFNRARQADYHERALYGSNRKQPNKLDRDRFAGQRSALGQPLDEFDPEEARKRHLTMASRHQKKQRRERDEADKFAAQIRADDPAELIPFEPDPDQVEHHNLAPEDVLTD